MPDKKIKVHHPQILGVLWLEYREEYEGLQVGDELEIYGDEIAETEGYMDRMTGTATIAHIRDTDNMIIFTLVAEEKYETNEEIVADILTRSNSSS